MNILVTGSTGFIGRHLCEYLTCSHKIYYLKRSHSNPIQIGPNGNNFYVAENNINELSEYLLENKIDGIIHLASLYIQKHNENDIPGLIHSNIYLGTTILEAASKAKLKWFINTGTIWQNYNSPEGKDVYCPVNLYAATKQAFMDIAKFYSETTNMRICTLKLCDTYGPNDTRRKIFSLFEEYAKTGEILRMSPGEQKLDIIHINDVILGFAKLINLLNSDNEFLNEYVLTSGEHISLKELAAKYEVDNNVKLNIEWGALPYRDREVMVPYKGNKLQ